MSLMTCTWREDEGAVWWTDCNEAHEFMNAGPSENSYRFCCYCGKPLVEESFQGEEEE